MVQDKTVINRQKKLQKKVVTTAGGLIRKL